MAPDGGPVGERGGGWWNMVMTYILCMKCGATNTYHGDGEWRRLVRLYDYECRYVRLHVLVYAVC